MDEPLMGNGVAPLTYDELAARLHGFREGQCPAAVYESLGEDRECWCRSCYKERRQARFSLRQMIHDLDADCGCDDCKQFGRIRAKYA